MSCPRLRRHRRRPARSVPATRQDRQCRRPANCCSACGPRGRAASRRNPFFPGAPRGRPAIATTPRHRAPENWETTGRLRRRAACRMAADNCNRRGRRHRARQTRPYRELGPLRRRSHRPCRANSRRVRRRRTQSSHRSRPAVLSEPALSGPAHQPRAPIPARQMPAQRIMRRMQNPPERPCLTHATNPALPLDRPPNPTYA